MAAYVELNRVSYRYPGAARILKEIDLTIPAGESTAVFGASGSGKSTLTYLLNGLIPHFFGGLLEGTVVVAGNSTRNKMVSELFSHVGLVLQNTDAQLFNATVEDDIAFGLESLGYPAADIRKRTCRISEALGIPHLLHRSPETLSGGEKRLAAIATVLCLDPALLVLDEPFAGLDHKGTRILRDLLRQIQRHGKNLILIEHRTKSFFTEADRCIVIDQGAVSFDGKPAEASDVLWDLHLMPHYPERMARMRSRSEESVLVVKDLSCRIEGRDVLSDISLSLTRGEAVAIVGENGAGKTTLIKHFNGLYQPTTGEVSFKGRCIRSLHPSARAAAVGVCLQNPNDQFFEADVRKEILAGPKRLGQVDWKWFEQICDTLSLHLLLDRSPYRLSEGEKRRVALASILIMRPDVLVLDEPTAGQDGRFKETLAHMCASISEMGTAVVVVTHDLDFARTTTDRWVVMHAGRIAADGTPEKMCEKLLSILEDTTERPLGSVADCL